MRRKSSFKDRFFAKKWLVIAITAMLLTIFGRVIDNKSLTQSGIVIGLGIDYKEDMYDVTIQAVAVSGSAGSDKASTSFLTYSSKGETIGDAVNSLSEKLGLIVSLSHCNLVVMSRSALALDPVRTFSALTKSLSLPAQALIVATDTDIREVFSSKIPSTDNISFFLQSVLLQDLGAGGLTTVSVKDYLATRLSRSGGTALPYLELHKMTDKPITNSQGGDDNYIVDINKNLVIDGDGDMVVEENIAKAINMFLNDKVKDKLVATLPDVGIFEFGIIKTSKSVKVDGMKVFAEIEMTVSFVEAREVDSTKELNCDSPQVIDASKQLEKDLAKYLMDSFYISKETDIDFLGLENVVYQKAGHTLEKKCLDQIDFHATYTIKVTENA